MPRPREWKRARAAAATFGLLAWIAVSCVRHEAAAATGAPTRVVVLGPSTAENLFALGLGDRVVGVSDYCVDPAGAVLPRVGGQANPNLERVAVLAPDMVITQGSMPDLERLLEQLDIRHLAFHTDTWKEWEDEVLTLGATFGVEERAARLLAERRAALAGLGGSPPDGRTPSAVLVVAGRPGSPGGLMVAGGGSFLNELLAAAGGRNAFQDNPRDYFDLGSEALLRAAPEVVFELRPGQPPPGDQDLEAWRTAFPNLPAVRGGQVHILCEDFLLLPGPRMPATAALLGRLLREGALEAPSR